ncbi:MAG: hypothetical protein LBO20_04020 [Bifidobacteriaceae bacterium]|jgi:hypothetical protein|nr:hypothetical protein [Bifidobacteriaceae bacterium]
MDKPLLERLTAQLEADQAAVAAAVEEVKARLAPAALAEEAKDRLAQAAKTAAIRPDGRPKRWVFIAVAVTAALVAVGIAVRLARRAK